MATRPEPDDLSPPADWSAPERRLWSAFRNGSMLDLRTGIAVDDDPVDGAAWGPERQISAHVIALLLLDGPPANPGKVRALRVTGARVTGELDLTSAAIDCEIDFDACSFSDALSLRHATTLAVYLQGSHLPELSAEALRCPGLDMRDAVVEGNVWIQGSDITLDLNLDRAKVGGWINGNLLTIGSWFNGRFGLSIGNWLSLSSARIGGVDLRQADIGHAESTQQTLGAHLLTCDTFWASDIRVAHGIILSGAQINGEAVLSKAVVHGSPSDEPAIRLDEIHARRLDIDTARADTKSVSLRGATIGKLVDRPQGGPLLELDALTYERLEPLPPRSTSIRLAWLKENLSGQYLPQPYEQLAAAYRVLGHDSEARRVLRAKHRHHRSTLPCTTKIWDWLQDAVAGYGYRPALAGGWLVTLTLLGTLVFSISEPQRSEPGRGPAFNPTVYTLDLLLPIIDFGQEKAFLPASGLQWFAYVLIALGWILATTLVAGLTRVLGRS
ncbi:oxidoreductase [Streptomyces sp. NPDC020799]|uniref:oxidoreductase n=1 Tax=Streptomyces sp. NPDC020799 TaxID=3365091 RepID=UPI0037A0B106